jgi:hypothetical protein
MLISNKYKELGILLITVAKIQQQNQGFLIDYPTLNYDQSKIVKLECFFSR